MIPCVHVFLDQNIGSCIKKYVTNMFHRFNNHNTLQRLVCCVAVEMSSSVECLVSRNRFEAL